MAKLVKWGTSGDTVDAVEVEEREEFQPYDGPMPPKNTILRLKVVRINAVKFKTGSRGIKVFAVVDDPSKEKYEGLPYWDNVIDTEAADWKIRQFMDAIGGTGADWDKTYIEEQADGDPLVVKFGKIKTDGLYIRISHKTGANQDGDPRAEIQRYLKKDAAAEARKGSGSSSKASTSDGADDDPPF